MIREAAEDGMISPFDPGCMNPASYDLRLGNSIRVTHAEWEYKEVRQEFRELPREEIQSYLDYHNLFEIIPWETDGYLLLPGQFILAHSVEYLRIPVTATAFLHTKSSAGRIGLDHCVAGFFDPGFGLNTERGAQATFEFMNVSPKPILLKAGMRLVQLVFMQMAEPPERPYFLTGRYNDQQGAEPAREPKS